MSSSGARKTPPVLKARIIPCLDVKDGRVVKGINFVDLRDAGDPVNCAVAYDKAGDRVLSGSYDRTIKIWDCGKIKFQINF